MTREKRRETHPPDVRSELHYSQKQPHTIETHNHYRKKEGKTQLQILQQNYTTPKNNPHNSIIQI
jgi:hypothetical protein